MKIRTFVRLLGITAIGGVAYVHTQRGGEWTVASLRETLRHLKRSMGDMLNPQGDIRHSTLERAANVTESATRGTLADERSARSYGDYTQRKTDPGQH